MAPAALAINLVLQPFFSTPPPSLLFYVEECVTNLQWSVVVVVVVAVGRFNWLSRLSILTLIAMEDVCPYFHLPISPYMHVAVQL